MKQCKTIVKNKLIVKYQNIHTCKNTEKIKIFKHRRIPLTPKNKIIATTLHPEVNYMIYVKQNATFCSRLEFK